MSHEFERAYYRLVYPISFRPHLRLGRERCPVVDLSEQGIRFLCEGQARPAIRDNIRGFLELRTGELIEIGGTVVRVEAAFVSAFLSEGVPFGVMLEQQRFLQQRLVGWR